MDYTETKTLKQRLIAMLSEKRYRHSLGVAEEAAQLAEIHGANREKAIYAGLAHDIAKCCTREELNEMVLRFGLPTRYLDNPALAHAKVGAALLREELGVEDEEVLAAVASHTTGRPDMSLLEEILYVADAIEPNRQYDGLEALRALAREDLDRACLEIMDFCIATIRKSGRTLDEDTWNARRFMQDKIKSKRRESEKMNMNEKAKAIASALSEKKAREITMIHIAEKSSFADFFVNATAGSERQLGALLDVVEEKAEELGLPLKGVEGRARSGWLLVDCGDIIVNIFTVETREKYALDKIWSDCEITRVEE